MSVTRHVRLPSPAARNREVIDLRQAAALELQVAERYESFGDDEQVARLSSEARRRAQSYLEEADRLTGR